MLEAINALRNNFSTIKDEYSDMVRKLYQDNEEVLNNKNERIRFLESELSKYNSMRLMRPVDDISREFFTLYPKASSFSYNNMIQSNQTTQVMDTIPTILIQWKGRRLRSSEIRKMNQYLMERLKLDTLELVIH